MKVITGYIVREILKGSFVALLFLLTLFNLFTFADELGDLGKGHYGLKEIFYYLALATPRVCYELIPYAALLGSLFVLGAMGNHRELIALQAAGLSIAGIIKIVLLAGAVLVLVTVLIGEFVAPLTERKAQLVKLSAQNEQPVLNSRDGLWLREGRQFINVRQILKSGELADLSIFEIDDQQYLRRALHAERASFLGDQQWRLKNINQSEITKQQITTDHQQERQWKSAIAPDLLKIVVVNPDNLSLAELAKYIDFLKGNRQKSQVYELAFWGRIVNPLITFVMMLLSAPFVIGIKRGISVGARMMLGVVIGMGFHIVNGMIEHLGQVNDLNPILVAFVPSLTVLLLALFFTGKVQRQ